MQLLGLVDVGLVVDRDVAEKPERERKRERVIVLLGQRDGAAQRLDRRRVVAEPVRGLAHSGQDPCLPHAPPGLRTRHRERALVAVDR